uniref:FbpB family small basic protein n=1 Tax=Panagrolaimus sp. JU765 TaxID=591449 RepID=A0AC34RQ58_9BILA
MFQKTIMKNNEITFNKFKNANAQQALDLSRIRQERNELKKIKLEIEKT